jgi:uncharacterized protein (TIGR03435 family)
VYALVLARSDGRLGPQLRKAAVDCASLSEAERRRSLANDLNAAPGCGIRVSPGRLMAGGVSISNFLTAGLSRYVQDRVVLDRTGLTGDFDVTLEWTPASWEIGPALALPGAAALPPPPADGPSIFTAVQEQLGLKLESRRGPVEVIVIERVEQPTPD